MKIVLLAELVCLLKDLHFHEKVVNDEIRILPSDKSDKTYRLFSYSASTALYVITYTEFISLQDFSAPLNSTLRDDYNFTIQTRYNTFRDIVRESSAQLYMARNSFPSLPYSPDERLSHDELESMEFQLLTKYTQNEVNAMMLEYLYRNYSPEHPRVQINFNVYDILSEDDLRHLIHVLKELLCQTTG